MNKIISRFPAFSLFFLVLFGACTKDATFSNNPNLLGTELSAVGNGAVLIPQVAEGKYIKDAYIVVLKDDVANVDSEVEQMVRGLGGAKPDHVYKHAIKGFSIKVPEAAIKGLLKNPKVKYIEQDQEVNAINTVTQTGATWGLDRVDQTTLPLSSTYSYVTTGSTVDAYIFDTGIWPAHAEFEGRVQAGHVVSGILATNSSDVNGHGTHVAGTVGGKTYGIAKKINLIPVKVLGDDGYGSTSGVAAGVDWAAGVHDTRPAVGNMSLGGGASTAIDEAVRGAIADGIVICVAAGNSNRNAENFSPARVVEAITVGATERNDSRASYSNFGTVLDLFAPGSSITSAWPSNTSTTATNTISGTSMASPHVAGVAALYLEAKPGSTPAQVQSGLKAVATPNKVTSPGTGSPNLLLYSGGFDGGGTTEPVAPAVPTLSSPANGATRVVTSPTLSWLAVTGAASYDVQVSTNTGFTSLVHDVSSHTGTTYVASNLRSKTTYYWQVRSKSSTGLTSTWSPYRRFTTR